MSSDEIEETVTLAAEQPWGRDVSSEDIFVAHSVIQFYTAASIVCIRAEAPFWSTLEDKLKLVG
jgi:hypothetical protein